MCAEVLVTDVVEKKEKQPESLKSGKMISVVASVSNFEASIQDLYDSLTGTMQKSGHQYEIIFVDDGSVDQTYESLLKIRSEDAQVKIIKMRALFGEAAALDAGIKQADGEIIIYIAGRVRVDTSGLLDLLATLEQGQDMVIGWRHPRADSFLNQIVSKVFNRITCKFAGSTLHDMNSGVLVAKREVLENVPIYGALNQFFLIGGIKGIFLLRLLI